MRRCKHSNCVISEEYILYYDHHFENDEYSGTTNNADLTGMLILICDECGLNKRISKHKAPKWARVKLEAM